MNARLRQKHEFMYSFRMLVYLLLHVRDFNRLAHLLVDYRKNIACVEKKFDETVLTKFAMNENPIPSTSVCIRFGEGLVTASGPLAIGRGTLFRQCIVPVIKQAVVLNEGLVPQGQ